MSFFQPILHERLFVPFLDEVDGTLCLPASATASDIESLADSHHLRFPLVLDEASSLRSQVDASTHTSASCRFGAFCDNILGMNWRLPNGRIVRIGEQVVKSTTGYDWLRFLLHSGMRFGEPVDYVLRLRPDCSFTAMARFDGGIDALQECVSKLLHSGWMHWWDAVDFIAESQASFVRVTIHCVPSEASLFVKQFEQISAASSTQLVMQNNVSLPRDGLPDLVIKTTPDRVIRLAREVASELTRCVALCYNGVVHVYLSEDAKHTERIQSLIGPWATELHSLGGDWHSRWLPSPPPTANESVWLDTLEKAIHAA